MVLALGLFFFIRFRPSIDYFLRNISSIKFPGGPEITAQLPTPPEEEADADTDVHELPSAQRELLDALWEQLESERLQAASDQQAWEQTARQLQWAALYWEFMYLSKFLVPRTKLALKMLRDAQPPWTRQAFNHYWSLWRLGDVGEREAVYSALTTTGLVQDEQSVLTVTSKGESFLHFPQAGQ